MTAKHTPGPWRFMADDNEVPFSYRGSGFCYNPGIYGPDGEPVVECDEYYVFSGEADARLIAAAPELLEALKSIVSNRGKCFIPTAELATPELLGWDDRAAAAIAKAEGE